MRLLLSFCDSTAHRGDFTEFLFVNTMLDLIEEVLLAGSFPRTLSVGVDRLVVARAMLVTLHRLVHDRVTSE